MSISPLDHFAIGRPLKMRRSAYRLIKKIGPSDLFSPNNIDWVRRSPGFLARRPIPRGPWRNASDLEIATATWVEFYNKMRLHGSLDRMTPAEFEAAYWEPHP